MFCLCLQSNLRVVEFLSGNNEFILQMKSPGNFPFSKGVLSAVYRKWGGRTFPPKAPGSNIPGHWGQFRFGRWNWNWWHIGSQSVSREGKVCTACESLLSSLLHHQNITLNEQYHHESRSPQSDLVLKKKHAQGVKVRPALHVSYKFFLHK